MQVRKKKEGGKKARIRTLSLITSGSSRLYR